MRTVTDGELRWYAIGYFDGRTSGIEVKQPELELHRRFYAEGYEAGVSDYCAEAHPEEVNE